MKSIHLDETEVRCENRKLLPIPHDGIGSFGDRVDFIARSFGGVPQLARTMGVSEAVVRKWRANQSDPSRANLVSLAKVGDVDIDWLATGNGVMRSESDTEDSATTDPHPDEFAYIPLLAVEACAGHGSFVDSEEIITKLAFRRDWLHREVHANPAHLHLIYVRGDSMEPTLSDGEVIMIDRSANTPNRDGIFVIQMDDAILIKRIQPLPGNRLRIMSDNKRYPDIEADLQQHPLRMVGKVIWHAGRI